MAKNLDGIKKLNPEEIKKNRKIVLSYIGEKDSKLIGESKVANQVVSIFNKVDGIKSNKIFSLKPRVKNILEKSAPFKDGRPSKPEKINLEKAKAEEAEKRQEKFRLEEKIKEAERIIKENKLLEKIKRKEEIKRIKQELKSAKAKTALKRKLKRQKNIKLFKKNLNNKLGKIFSIVKQNFAYGTLYLASFLIISYAVVCLLVLRFKIDDNIIGKIERVLPVPAAVTSQGIINYFDYRNIKNNNFENLSEKKNNLAKWIILKNLSGKYNLPVNSSREVLALAFVADEDFNQVGLSRIKKISELLKNVDDLEQLSKYADEYSEVVYYDNEEATEKFGQTVFNLNADQISDIIFSGNGYYIAQIVDNKNGQFGIKYLFVGAKTLDQYVGERLAKIKIFILAN